MMARSRNISNTKSRKQKDRYKNPDFLKALGEHCRQLRKKRGYSIERLSRESDRLSPASIDRLERGLADPQILVLLRYADVLNVPLVELFSFLKKHPELQQDSRIIPYEEELKPPAGYVPVYPIQVAAGKFANYEETTEAQPIGWVDAGVRAHAEDYFATFVKGDSMSPKIENGSLCLFRVYKGGSRQGKTFLIQARGLKNVETGESFVIKKYMRQTIKDEIYDEDRALARPSVIHLISDNPKYAPIVLVGLSDEEIQTIAEFIRVL